MKPTLQSASRLPRRKFLKQSLGAPLAASLVMSMEEHRLLRAAIANDVLPGVESRQRAWVA
jgi:hypothetical protein